MDFARARELLQYSGILLEKVGAQDQNRLSVSNLPDGYRIPRASLSSSSTLSSPPHSPVVEHTDHQLSGISASNSEPASPFTLPRASHNRRSLLPWLSANIGTPKSLFSFTSDLLQMEIAWHWLAVWKSKHSVIGCRVIATTSHHSFFFLK